MPIADVRYRFRELGRLRLGEPGEKAPRKLDTWRLTSPDRGLIVAAANLWGGEPMPWDDAPTEGKQFQVTTEATELPVLIPPQDVDASQWFELWTGGGIQRRCDGIHEVTTDGPCLCDAEDRMCKPTTHALFLLPDLPDVGVWHYVTRGFYAAAELPQAIGFLSQLAHGSAMPAAKLAIETRTTKAGRTTHHYPVAVIRSAVSIGEIIDQASRVGIGPSEAALAGAPALAPGESTDTPQEHAPAPRVAKAGAPSGGHSEPASPASSAAPVGGAADRQHQAPRDARQTPLVHGEGTSDAGGSHDGAGAAPHDDLESLDFDTLLARATAVAGNLTKLAKRVRETVDDTVRGTADLEHWHLVEIIRKSEVAA